MKEKVNANFNCDIETGLCEPASIHQQTKNATIINHTIKPKIIYYYDALCGWCYGFSPVVKELHNYFKDKLDIELISGGLFLGNRTGNINEIAPYIKAGAYKSVETTTGVKFGEKFLSVIFGNGKMYLNSLLPSIALCIVKDQFPERQLEFGEILLNAFYTDGLNANDIVGIGKYASKININSEEFIVKMNEEKYKQMAEKEFEIFQKSNYSGMPTLVLQKENQEFLLSNGYTNFNNLKSKIENILNY